MKEFQFLRMISALLLATIAVATSPSYAIGEWNAYQNYSKNEKMAYAHGQCYVLASKHLYVADLSGDDYSFASLTRLSGLSGSEIFSIEACPTLDMLCIVYADGNIDLLDANQTINNIPDVKYTNVIGDKSIQGIHVQGTQLFISTGFGFLVLDLENASFPYSVQTGASVTLAFGFGQHLYYSNDRGTFFCDRSAPLNAPSSWKHLSDTKLVCADVFDVDGEQQGWVISADNRLYSFSDDSTLVLFDDQSFYRTIFHNDDYLILTGSGIHSIDLRKPIRISNYSGEFNSTMGMGQPDDSTLYILHSQNGLRVARINSYNNNWKFDVSIIDDYIGFQQVGSPRIGNMLYRDGVLTALTGGLESINYNAAALQDGSLSILHTQDETWEIIPRTTIDSQLMGMSRFYGVQALAFDAANPDRVYVGGINCGVFHLEGDSVIAYYDYRNSELPQYTNHDMSRCTAIMADDDGSEWFACGGTPYNLTRLSAEGKWTKYQLCNGETMHAPQRIIRSKVDPYHLIWVVDNMTYESSKIAVLYDGGTPENTSDDKAIYFRTMIDQDGNSIDPNYYYFDVAEDKNGAVWILTSSGPFVVDSQVDAFNNPGKVRRPKIPRNDGSNLADYLMAGVTCTCIAIDAANRKWIGTLNNGLYILSADGLTQLEHFTTENSPLPSDYIMALAMDEETGTVYISAEGGICSYKTDAISGAKDYKATYCYPNPVRPDFTGDLHVMGLMDQTKVRICDVANHVLFETVSEGGMVSWNLQGADGRRVKSGVYLIYGIDEAGKSGCISKFLVIE